MSYILGGSLVAVAVKKDTGLRPLPDRKSGLSIQKVSTITATDRELYRPFLQIIADSSSTST